MLYILLKSLASIIATTCFGVIFNIKGKKIFYTGIGGGIAWFVFDVLNYLKFPHVATYFFASVALTIFSELMAYKLKTTVTVFLIPALIPLVPGGGIYYSLLYIVQNDLAQASHKGIETLFFSGALAFGILFVSTISDVVGRVRSKNK